MENDKYLMWLLKIEGIGSKKITSLMDVFPDLKEVWYAPSEKLCMVLPRQNVHSIIKARNEDFLLACEKEVIDANISFISIQNKLYPSLLKEIHDPPIALYMFGELPDDHIPVVSVIGARRCSEYGLSVSYKLSKDLAAHGIVVASGMAKGIDASSHRGALNGGGPTIAVLGCGVDICYPSENRGLRDEIIKNGCVISEYPPGTKPIAGNFPMRNRIISGLSQAVVVVEAAERSGTLITVDMALEQGREVLAVPGSITSKLSKGTNDLIRQGAGVLVTGYEDVLHAINLPENLLKDEHEKKQIEPELAPDEKQIYNCLSLEPISIENIARVSGQDSYTVQYILTMLEIKGHITKLPGQRYILHI